MPHVRVHERLLLSHIKATSKNRHVATLRCKAASGWVDLGRLVETFHATRYLRLDRRRHISRDLSG